MNLHTIKEGEGMWGKEKRKKKAGKEPTLSWKEIEASSPCCLNSSFLYRFPEGLSGVCVLLDSQPTRQLLHRCSTIILRSALWLLQCDRKISAGSTLNFVPSSSLKTSTLSLFVSSGWLKVRRRTMFLNTKKCQSIIQQYNNFYVLS